MLHLEQDLKTLVNHGKSQGYLTYDEINAYLPDQDVTPEKLDNLLVALDESGIELVDKAPVKDGEPAAPTLRIAPETIEPTSKLDIPPKLTSDPIRMFASATQLAASEPRYCLVWADGTRSVSPEIENWGAANWKPSLARHLIFDEKNPARRILDTIQPRHRLNAPYVEFQSGDRLAGRVTGYRDADEALGLPVHFVIEPVLAFGLPKVFSRPQVRIRADAVRRIVIRSGIKQHNAPNWLQTVDGSSESFRS